VPVERDDFDRYRLLIQREAERYGLDLGGMSPVEDDDHWQAKIDILLSDPVPIVGFTFGIPDRPAVEALQRAGSTLVQTVTSVEEARMAADCGLHVLAVQSFEAGGHWGTLTPQRRPPKVPLAELISRVRHAIDLPLLAAGGIATSADVSGALRAGAGAVMVGTALLRADESGASAPYKAALAESGDRDTLLTRAFTGRPARAIPNLFTDRYQAEAPSGYPAIHHLTSPIRRAAAAAGDPDRINLWAGTGHRQAQQGAAATVLARLAESV
jgi:NAD(P)H-dependent flavin oxidoreductase YrpB (nitropropane dioxygenase family)